ncbi:hypothetical protein KL945_003753 [Ogataea haglerorum]|nr:hypothetical protein KL945_003753 [Ogataea haglerorum]
MNRLAQSIQRSEPVLLVGRSGTGKTFLINEVAKQLQLDTMVKIHLNQQTDPKLLLGTYSSGAKPGTFEWKNGVLTTAVKEGRWVLVEDIDKAPNEVLSILLSLLEKRELTIPSRGEVIKAANGFQLISSLRVAGDLRRVALPDMIGLRLWNVVELEELDANELRTILDTKFPLLANFTAMFIRCFQDVRELYGSRKFLSMNRGAQPRALTIRDLMKLCRRCTRILEDRHVDSASRRRVLGGADVAGNGAREQARAVVRGVCRLRVCGAGASAQKGGSGAEAGAQEHGICPDQPLSAADGEDRRRCGAVRAAAACRRNRHGQDDDRPGDGAAAQQEAHRDQRVAADGGGRPAGRVQAGDDEEPGDPGAGGLRGAVPAVVFREEERAVPEAAGQDVQQGAVEGRGAAVARGVQNGRDAVCEAGRRAREKTQA